MSIATETYIRKPLYVEAIRITQGNFDAIAAWCQGEIQKEEKPGKPDKPYIRIRVHNPKNPRQTMAFVGDWVLYTPKGYKIYTNRAFQDLFDLVTSEEVVTENGRKEIPKTVEDVPEQEKIVPVAAEGKRVLSIEEQKKMDSGEVRSLLQSGEVVLAQDIAQP